jgi:hypothetical protein
VIQHGTSDQLRELLEAHPEADLNVGVQGSCTPLHLVAFLGDSKKLRLLLDRPGIDINVREVGTGVTPFMSQVLSIPSHVECLECVRMWLEDWRLDVNAVEGLGCSVLWFCCRWWCTNILRLVVAIRGHELVLDQRGRGREDETKKTTGWECMWQKARVSGYRLEPPEELQVLMSGLRNDREGTIFKARLALSMRAEIVSDLFAAVVCFCDDYFCLPAKGIHATRWPKYRFFLMISRLPMELQMVVCNRAYGSASDVVLTKNSEIKYKRLLKK